MLDERQLYRLAERVWPVAEDLGLEPGHVHFELVAPDFIPLLAANGGLPIRYGHWSFGKSQQRLKTAFDFRLTQIYELVLNNVPAYAFVDETASLGEALMIVAHVLAHADFFRHHRGFRPLGTDMVTQAARHRQRVAEWRRQYGDQAVETLIDAAHVLAEFSGETLGQRPMGEGEDDVLGFAARSAPRLDGWERDLLALIWSESRYFWPQVLTKMANEGYATYYHTEILRRLDLNAEESWETARLNAKIVQVTPPKLNPYRVGLLLFQEAARVGGNPALFGARDLYDDVGLARAFMTDAVVEKAGLALYRGRESDSTAHPAAPDELRRRLIYDLDHAGLPRLAVEPSSDQTLRLKHLHDGRDLDFAELPFALKLVAERLWKGPVTLLTERQRVPHRVTHNGSDWIDQVM